MIIEIEDRFCKVAEAFSTMLNKVLTAAERGDAVHEVEEMTWSHLIKTGRETSIAYINQRAERRTLSTESDRIRGEDALPIARATYTIVCFGLRPDAIPT